LLRVVDVPPTRLCLVPFRLISAHSPRSTPTGVPATHGTPHRHSSTQTFGGRTGRACRLLPALDATYACSHAAVSPVTHCATRLPQAVSANRVPRFPINSVRCNRLTLHTASKKTAQPVPAQQRARRINTAPLGHGDAAARALRRATRHYLDRCCTAAWTCMPTMPLPSISSAYTGVDRTLELT